MILRLVPHLALAVALLACPTSSRAADPPPKPVDFDRDVKPILAKHCVSCHGADKQKSSLRLDRRTDALSGGDGGAVIVPGKAADSRLIKLVSDDNPDTRMPPKGPRLTAAEIVTLQQWINEGAKGPDDSAKANPADWWSLKPLTKPAVPAGANPIDHFIRAKLKEKGLTPSPEADRRTLIRRLYFDLTGLPPSPEEVDAFVISKDAGAYEKLVDKLLASPQYGERWARHWLDVVHFGETHGYDKDKPRPNAWPYRDYVIRAFNQDKPYGRFVAEQIAGDVLSPGTVDGIEALGFLAAGPWDFIGHAEVPESKIDGKVARHLDRDDFVANTLGTFMSLTVHCAQCHNHKFDPITQEDYYKLQAVFAALDRTDKTYDADSKVAVKRADLEAKKKAATEQVTVLEFEARKKAGAELTALEKQIADATKPANAPKPPEFGYHSQLSARQDSAKWVQVDLSENVKLDRVVIRPCLDDFNNIGPGFGFPVRFKIELSDDPAFKTSVVLADETAKDFANPGMVAYSAKAEGKAGRYLRVTATKLAPRQNDYILALAELEALDADGKNLAHGKPVTALDSIEAPVRWRKSNLTDGLYPPGPKLAATELAKLTERRDSLLKSALGEKGIANLVTLRTEVTATDAELAKLSGSRRVAYIGAIHTGSGTFVGTGAAGGKPRPIHILPRGDVTKPGKEVARRDHRHSRGERQLQSAEQRTPKGERRAALAKWLTDAKNPLTWRVMANRVWQYHFGRGIVDTPNDFGKMGQLPTHPELLDLPRGRIARASITQEAP
jgi:mono/diheme cytochrome c family protein